MVGSLLVDGVVDVVMWLCVLTIVKTGMGYSLCHLLWGGGLASGGVEATGVLTHLSSCSTLTLTSGVFTPTSLERGQGRVGVVVTDLVMWRLALFSWVRLCVL